jgi:hypothetical protein
MKQGIKETLLKLENDVHHLQLATKCDKEKFIFQVCRKLIYNQIILSKDDFIASFDDISDDEIENKSKEYMYNDKIISIDSFELGAKWYREQLKKL